MISDFTNEESNELVCVDEYVRELLEHCDTCGHIYLKIHLCLQVTKGKF